MLNRVTLHGYIVDLKVISKDNEKEAIEFLLGVAKKYKKINEGRDIEYFTIRAFNGLARFVLKTFDNGSCVIIEGKLSINPNTIKTEIIADECFFGAPQQNIRSCVIMKEGKTSVDG